MNNWRIRLIAKMLQVKILIAQISLGASRVNASSHLLCLAAMRADIGHYTLGNELAAELSLSVKIVI